jgi:hypothetical protein
VTVQHQPRTSAQRTAFIPIEANPGRAATPEAFALSDTKHTATSLPKRTSLPSFADGDAVLRNTLLVVDGASGSSKSTGLDYWDTQCGILALSKVTDH